MLAVPDGFTQSFHNNCGMNHKKLLDEQPECLARI